MYETSHKNRKKLNCIKLYFQEILVYVNKAILVYANKAILQ